LMQSTMGITGPQRLVLRIVSRAPGISAGELAHLVHLHPSTITGVLQRLIDKRLLFRERDPVDSRRVRLLVRQQARPLVAPSEGTVEAAVARALKRVPAAHLRHARTVLSTIAAALEDGRRSVGRGRPVSRRSGPRHLEAHRRAAPGRDRHFR
jgi:MarR family transcriptional regulator, organic hydroperoxide resistance regulator